MTNGTVDPSRPPAVVLCPIDFSEPSRGALRYAMTVAAQAGASLTVLTVNDPLLAQASDMARGAGSLDAEARSETERFFAETFGGRTDVIQPRFEIATGTPDAEILRSARKIRPAASCCSNWSAVPPSVPSSEARESDSDPCTTTSR